MDDIRKAQRLIEKGLKILEKTNPSLPVNEIDYFAWRTQCMSFIKTCDLPLPSRENYCNEFGSLVPGIQHVLLSELSNNVGIMTGIEILKSVKDDLETAEVIDDRSKPIDIISNLCERFPLVSRQLRSRHDSRGTLDIQDEYDVQDLFHALLHIHFEDIRPEEWTPSFAGASSRMDFLLKQEQIIIEIKKTRKGLDAKSLGNQLIEDIARYKVHQDCKTLICFVYDPEGRIANPRGIERDLSRVEDNLAIQVLIRP